VILESGRKSHTVVIKRNKTHELGVKKEELVEEYAPMIKYIAQRMAAKIPVMVEIGDLIDAGVIGLLDAAEKYDAGKGVQFKTYAEYRIKGAMLDELRRSDWLPRTVRRKSNHLERVYKDLKKRLNRLPEPEDMAKALDVSLDDYFKLLKEASTGSIVQLEELGRKGEDGTGWEERLYRLAPVTKQNDPFLSAQFKDMIEEVAKCFEELPERERLVLTLYYYEELTMKEIGYILKVTESRISQMRSQAILRLRACMREKIN